MESVVIDFVIYLGVYNLLYIIYLSRYSNAIEYVGNE